MEKSLQDKTSHGSSHFSNVSLRLFFHKSSFNPMWQFIINLHGSKEIPYK